MDTMPESAARTLVRIEVLVLQGIIRALMVFSIGVLVMPMVPFVVIAVRCRNAETTLWKRVMMMPIWFMMGMVISVISPFSALWRGAADTMVIAKVEWSQRWRNGTAKRLDGRPCIIPDPEEERMVDIAITKSVIVDYNEEAMMHGQGIPPID